MSDIKQFN